MPAGRSMTETAWSKRCERWAWRSRAPNACSARPATPWSAGMSQPRHGSGSRRTIAWRATCPSSCRRRCERLGASSWTSSSRGTIWPSRSGSRRGPARLSSRRIGPKPCGSCDRSTRISNESGDARSRDSDDFHLPLEDPQFLLLDGGGSDRNDQCVAALRDGIEQPSDELEDGVEGVVGYQVLDPVDQDRAARLLRHEVLELVHDALQRGGDRLLRRPLAIRQPEDLLRGEVVRLADALRIRARDDEPAAATREERGESAVRFRRSILLDQVTAARVESLEARRLARLRLHHRCLRRYRNGFGQDFPRELLGDRPPHHRGECDDAVEGSPQLPDVIRGDRRDDLEDIRV